MGKVLNVAARLDGSLAIDENGCVYIWGHCFNEKITIPIATAFSNIYDVYLYNVPYIIQEPLINPTGEKPNILKCLERVFDDQVYVSSPISYMFILQVIFLPYKM